MKYLRPANTDCLTVMCCAYDLEPVKAPTHLIKGGVQVTLQ